jgi:GTP-binding protein
VPIPRVAIVGRPNVGKSSLMNMLAGAKVSIVDPTPGVTRDRVTRVLELHSPDARPPRPVEFIDTGGFGAYTAPGERFDEIGADLHTLTDDIERQIAAAVESADLVLFCVDAQAGITAPDRDIAKRLREGTLGRKVGGVSRSMPRDGRRAPVRVVATKTDGPRWETHALEMSALGFGEPWMVSAKNNYMRRELSDSLYEWLEEHIPRETRADGSTPAPEAADLKLAIVGKRNSGKSTLVNTLAGEERVIVSEIAGTTRDAIDVRFDFGGRAVIAIDTAGLRRKKSFQGPVEWYAFDRAKMAIDRADVVLLMLDATEPVSQVDEQLGQLIQDSFKPCIICVNKWDDASQRAGLKGQGVTTKDYENYIREQLRGLWFAPISFMAARNNVNVRQTIDLAFDLREQAATRVTTGKLNRLVRGVIATRSPTDDKGTQAKIYFAAQTAVSPPTIVLVVNYPELFTPNYKRFLLNRFREELPFEEVPINLVVRARRQQEDDLRSDETGHLAAGGEHTPSGRRMQQRLAAREDLAAELSERGAGRGDPDGDDVMDDELLPAGAANDLGSDLGDDAAAYFEDPPRDARPRGRKASGDGDALDHATSLGGRDATSRRGGGAAAERIFGPGVVEGGHGDDVDDDDDGEADDPIHAISASEVVEEVDADESDTDGKFPEHSGAAEADLDEMIVAGEAETDEAAGDLPPGSSGAGGFLAGEAAGGTAGAQPRVQGDDEDEELDDEGPDPLDRLAEDAGLSPQEIAHLTGAPARPTRGGQVGARASGRAGARAGRAPLTTRTREDRSEERGPRSGGRPDRTPDNRPRSVGDTRTNRALRPDGPRRADTPDKLEARAQAKRPARMGSAKGASRARGGTSAAGNAPTPGPGAKPRGGVKPASASRPGATRTGRSGGGEGSVSRDARDNVKRATPGSRGGQNRPGTGGGPRGGGGAPARGAEAKGGSKANPKATPKAGPKASPKASPKAGTKPGTKAGSANARATPGTRSSASSPAKKSTRRPRG